MALNPSKSTTNSLSTFLNEGEKITWATKHLIVDMFRSFLVPRKTMAVLTALTFILKTILDVFVSFRGPINVPFLDNLVGPALNFLFQSNEYHSIPGGFFGYVEPLLGMALALLCVYWIVALLRHEMKLYTAWKAEKAA